MKIAILGASRHNVGGNVSTTAAGVAEARTAERPGFQRAQDCGIEVREPKPLKARLAMR